MYYDRCTEGSVRRVCIGYITNGFNDFAIVDGNGFFKELFAF